MLTKPTDNSILKPNRQLTVLSLLLVIALSTVNSLEKYEVSYQEGSYARIEIEGKTHIKYTVHLQKGQYLAFGYGVGMMNVDMVVFKSSTVPEVIDLYSYDETVPATDSQQDYLYNYTSNSTHVQFQASRLLVTTDSKDKAIKLHNGRGSFEAYVSNNGDILFQRDTSSTGWDYQLMAKVHGWFLWVAWSVLGFIQMSVNRYLKIYWKINMWIHRIVGTLIFILTVIMSIIGLRNHKYIFFGQYVHHILGFIVFFGITLLVAGGIITRSRMVRLRWKTSTILIFKNIHKSYGYLMLCIGQAAVLTGVLHYNERHYPQSDLWIPNIVIYILLWVLIEIMYQVFLRRESPFKSSMIKITVQEFESRVQSGQKLVLLDDFVLDVSKYMPNHPGGKFSLEANIGRDVSKFFYGGYSLENYTKLPPLHTHSNMARYIVNGLIVAQLDNLATSQVANMRIKSSNNVNKLTQTIIFEREDNQQVGFQRYFKDIQMIGRHYLVRSIKNKQVKRHYTVANCMEPNAYLVYLELLKGNSNAYQEKQDLFQEKSGGSFSITCKNYRTQQGVSRRLHEQKNDTFQVQGPLGKGLQIHPSGTHIAFTAGTGILVFVDLVAHLIRKNLNLLPPDEDSQISIKDFKFILYASFQSEQDSIAYEMCKGLHTYCESKGLKNFEFNVRFSNAVKTRWDYGFIEKVLSVYGDRELQRVWVCGIPKMNEDFHRAFENLAKNNQIKTTQYEIL
ncbi:cytochrome b5-like heme steroid binding domain containing protein [Stylonychia lemnae]|uniref:Cytochrome b5-like heme steroid binding domain containing protein n=1 Tax=Stylonychia lemnae TaxID=5949 RepID=A0A078AHD3_STYLE|nr:cytochrome b5-like heme steroid binding domain containing protein [Stylonychia lemnae]|eukprot:CDW80902.1 cytochrome b5-like heme steroid binding domain containing protein [Stylonychia lemnae]